VAQFQEKDRPMEQELAAVAGKIKDTPGLV
jgi:hypothetical protein